MLTTGHDMHLAHAEAERRTGEYLRDAQAYRQLIAPACRHCRRAVLDQAGATLIGWGRRLRERYGGVAVDVVLREASAQGGTRAA